jgi:8-oxo-dGTP pyrophosphatase MutT (NUDIX family)
MIKTVVRSFSTAPTKKPHEEYSVPRLSSSVVLCRRNKLFLAAYDYEVLLLKRKSSTRTFAHMLSFPGGRLEQEDS